MSDGGTKSQLLADLDRKVRAHARSTTTPTRTVGGD
jgi:hypothetical protein